MLVLHRRPVFPLPKRFQKSFTAGMATIPSLSHLERIAEQPRDEGMHLVTISRIDCVNDTIRLFQLKSAEGEKRPIKFQPGQWLDVYVPAVPRTGGFTITSPPSLLSSKSGNSYVELAVKKSPTNPPAAWLWRNENEIIGKELTVRVGGSFVWPPQGIPKSGIRRAVFVAGGVGINPLMSIVSSLLDEKKARGKLGFELRFLYTTKVPGAGKTLSEILFWDRLKSTFQELGGEGGLQLFLTGGQSIDDGEGRVDLPGDKKVAIQKRRITHDDLANALGPIEERAHTVCYICGVPTMTDEFVEKAQKAEGMDKRNVLFEKWW